MQRIVSAVRTEVPEPATSCYFNGLPTAELTGLAYRGIGVTLYSSAVFCFAPEIALAFHRALHTGDDATVNRLLDGFYRPWSNCATRAADTPSRWSRRAYGCAVWTWARCARRCPSRRRAHVKELAELIEHGLALAGAAIRSGRGPLMRAGAFVYPWDVVGDPDAAAPHRGSRRPAGHPRLRLPLHARPDPAPPPAPHRHRRHSAVLYPPDPARWSGRELRPYSSGWASWTTPDGPYGEAAARAERSRARRAHLGGAGAQLPSGRGLPGHQRASTPTGTAIPGRPASPAPKCASTRSTLAAEAAVRPGTRGTELESCGWYGLAHLHAHDKTGGVRLAAPAQYLMSLCFCAVCREGYAGLGADPEELRSAVVRALEPVWSGASRPEDGPAGRDGERAEVRRLLGDEAAAVFAAWRGAAARRLRRDAVAAVREAASARPDSGDFRVLLHADPAPHRVGANAGVDPAEAAEDADGVVVPCTGRRRTRRRTGPVRRCTRHPAPSPSPRTSPSSPAWAAPRAPSPTTPRMRARSGRTSCGSTTRGWPPTPTSLPYAKPSTWSKIFLPGLRPGESPARVTYARARPVVEVSAGTPVRHRDRHQ